MCLNFIFQGHMDPERLADFVGCSLLCRPKSEGKLAKNPAGLNDVHFKNGSFMSVKIKEIYGNLLILHKPLSV
jgi:hypothetical protein